MATEKGSSEESSSAHGVLIWWLVITLSVGVAVCGIVPGWMVHEARGAVRDAASGGWDARKSVVAKLGGPERAGRLLSFYLQFPDKIAPDKPQALALLCCSRPTSVEPVRRLLHSSDEHVRNAALWCMAEFPGDTAPAAPELIGLLRHDSHDAREWAAEALARANRPGPDVIVALLVAANDPKERVRCAVVEALGRLGAGREEVLPALHEALTDRRSQVRRAAIQALSARDVLNKRTALALGRALRALLGEMRSSSWERSAEFDAILICQCLGRFKHSAEEAEPFLETAMEDASPDVRAEAAMAYHRTCSSWRGISVLERMLNGEDRRGRWLAAEALAELGPTAKQAIGALTKALEAAGNDHRVRASIRKALHAIETGDADRAAEIATESEPEWCAGALRRLQTRVSFEFVLAPLDECLKYVADQLGVEQISSDKLPGLDRTEVTMLAEQEPLDQFLKQFTMLGGLDYEFCPEGLRIMRQPEVRQAEHK